MKFSGLMGLLVCCVVADSALGDPQIWPAPHGMFGVTVDDDDKLQVLEGIGSFENQPDEDPKTTSNVSGNFILIHNEASAEDDLLGGFAERTIDGPADRIAPLRADLPEADGDSKVLFTDEPGFFTQVFPVLGNAFPVGYTLHVNYVGQLLYNDGAVGGDWGPAPGGEVLRILDYSGADNTSANVKAEDSADDNVVLELMLDATTEGVRGRINLSTKSSTFSSIHSHLAYELSRPDGDGNPTLKPTEGAYMVELFLSGDESGGLGVLGDSDPLFIVFNNQTDETLPGVSFANAVAAAEALPEPTSLLSLAGIGMGLLALGRRSSRAAGSVG